jgi:hypothetical protein
VTSTALSASFNPAVAGQPVALTAKVNQAVPGPFAPTGLVTFIADGTTLGSATLDSNGSATLFTTALWTGYHDLTAIYQGDPNFTGSTSPVLNELVNQDGTTTAIGASGNPVVVGQPLTLTATVAGIMPGFGPPTGQVLFLDGQLTIGTGGLSGGVATFTTAALAPGSHSFSAIYLGDGSFTGSSDLGLAETVNNPAPVVSSLSTAAVPEGSGAFTLALNGAGFLPTSAVQWNATPLTVTAAGSTQLQVTVPAALLADEGTAQIVVTNAGPGGGPSLAQAFTISDAPLTASSLNISVTGNKAFSGVVATFTDANPFATKDDFSAVIVWDNGTASLGIIGGSGPFTVSASHKFAGFTNLHVVKVTIYDKGGNTAAVVDNIIDPADRSPLVRQNHHRWHHHQHAWRTPERREWGVSRRPLPSRRRAQQAQRGGGPEAPLPQGERGRGDGRKEASSCS